MQGLRGTGCRSGRSPRPPWRSRAPRLRRRSNPASAHDTHCHKQRRLTRAPPRGGLGFQHAGQRALAGGRVGGRHAAGRIPLQPPGRVALLKQLGVRREAPRAAQQAGEAGRELRCGVTSTVLSRRVHLGPGLAAAQRPAVPPPSQRRSRPPWVRRGQPAAAVPPTVQAAEPPALHTRGIKRCTASRSVGCTAERAPGRAPRCRRRRQSRSEPCRAQG